jgi:hypothetical protein
MLPAGCHSSFIIFWRGNNGRIKNTRLLFLFPAETLEIFVRLFLHMLRDYPFIILLQPVT